MKIKESKKNSTMGNDCNKSNCIDVRLDGQSKIRKVSMVCPICGNGGQCKTTEKRLRKTIPFCMSCGFPLDVFDEDGRMVGGAFPISDDLAWLLGLDRLDNKASVKQQTKPWE
jgi:predicted RNA-binding Zn-ribbon protein involved in translation (DUF1610 family)